jgi:hypothetical protein
MVFLAMSFIWALIPLYANQKIWETRHKIIVGAGYDDGKAWEDLVDRHDSQLRELTAQSKTVKSIFIDMLHFRHLRQGFYGLAKKLNTRYKNNKVYLVARWSLVFLFAPPSAIIWLVLAVMWGMGVRRLIDDRHWATPPEDEWGFGQVLPILLLVLPFFTVGEVWQGMHLHIYSCAALTHVRINQRVRENRNPRIKGGSLIN